MSLTSVKSNEWVKHFNHCPMQSSVRYSNVTMVNGQTRRKAKCGACGLVSVEPVEGLEELNDLYTEEMSLCCDWPVSETGFCTSCWEHA